MRDWGVVIDSGGDLMWMKREVDDIRKVGFIRKVCDVVVVSFDNGVFSGVVWVVVYGELYWFVVFG